MEYSENFNFALPSRDNDVDLADINEIANNFRKIDENAVKKEQGKSLSTNDFTDAEKQKLGKALLPEDVEQEYNSKSESAQSGIAVAEAVYNVAKMLKCTKTGNPILIDDVANIEHNLDIKTTPNTKVFVRGKNLIPFTNNKFNEGYMAGYTYGNNGVNFTINSDGSVTVAGTATDEAKLAVMVWPATETGVHTVTLSGSPEGASATTYCLRLTKGATNAEIFEEYGNGITISGVNPSGCSVYIVVKSGVTINKTFYPMLEFGEVASEFVPPRTIYSGVTNADGKINTIKSLYPYMCVYTETNSDVECIYIGDALKAVYDYVNDVIGDIETALDEIIEIQESLIGSGEEEEEKPTVRSGMSTDTAGANLSTHAGTKTNDGLLIYGYAKDTRSGKYYAVTVGKSAEAVATSKMNSSATFDYNGETWYRGRFIATAGTDDKIDGALEEYFFAGEYYDTGASSYNSAATAILNHYFMVD